jgi:hypothetical protein
LTLLILEDCAFTLTQDTMVSAGWMLALFSPFVAGSFVGAVAPMQARRGIAKALGVLILHSCAVGFLMQPQQQCLLFAAWQLLFWLPAGLGSASLTSACLRYVRRQRFWQMAR